MKTLSFATCDVGIKDNEISIYEKIILNLKIIVILSNYQ